MNKIYMLMSAVLCLLLSWGAVCMSQTAPSGFVYIADAVPDAILEIRYYSTCNFVGDRSEGYRLKVFDACRPRKAIRTGAGILKLENTPEISPATLRLPAAGAMRCSLKNG